MSWVVIYEFLGMMIIILPPGRTLSTSTSQVDRKSTFASFKWICMHLLLFDDSFFLCSRRSWSPWSTDKMDGKHDRTGLKDRPNVCRDGQLDMVNTSSRSSMQLFAVYRSRVGGHVIVVITQHRTAPDSRYTYANASSAIELNTYWPAPSVTRRPQGNASGPTSLTIEPIYWLATRNAQSTSLAQELDLLPCAPVYAKELRLRK